jgi:nucleoside-diphosphate-sugar epimerase
MAERYLITGGAGSVGSRVVTTIADQGGRVVILDNFSAYPRRFYECWLPRSRRVEIVEGDVRDERLVRQLTARADRVIHMAARADVAECTRNPRGELEDNVIATQNVLDAVLASRATVQRLVFISSASVYGSRPRSRVIPRFTESDPCAPISHYGLSKLWGEQRCLLYHDFYGVPATALRLFSCYGSPQVPKPGSHSWCVAIFATQLLHGKPITILGDGEQVRDFVHVSDVARAIAASAVLPASIGRVMNVGTGAPTSINDVGRLVAACLGAAPVVQPLAPRPDDPRGGYADTALAQELLGWRATTPLPKGIEEYVEWLTRQRARLDA